MDNKRNLKDHHYFYPFNIRDINKIFQKWTKRLKVIKSNWNLIRQGCIYKETELIIVRVAEDIVLNRVA